VTGDDALSIGQSDTGPLEFIRAMHPLKYAKEFPGKS
jgi:hypothetical protein